MFNFPRFMLCLLAAGSFWLLNALNRTGYAINVEYPVRFVYNDAAFVPTLPLPRTITVNVSGSGWRLLGQSLLPLRDKPVEYVVKNPLRASIINTSSLTAALADRIKSLKVNYVVADTLDMAFDQRMSKTVRLVPDSLSINLAPRFVVASVINISPDTVRVEGPARLVRGIGNTLLVKIPGKRIQANYDEEVTLHDFKHPSLKTSTNRVSVSFEVGELLSQ
jgi:hypothetical protein